MGKPWKLAYVISKNMNWEGRRPDVRIVWFCFCVELERLAVTDSVVVQKDMSLYY